MLILVSSLDLPPSLLLPVPLSNLVNKSKFPKGNLALRIIMADLLRLTSLKLLISYYMTNTSHTYIVATFRLRVNSLSTQKYQGGNIFCDASVLTELKPSRPKYKFSMMLKPSTLPSSNNIPTIASTLTEILSMNFYPKARVSNTVGLAVTTTMQLRTSSSIILFILIG